MTASSVSPSTTGRGEPILGTGASFFTRAMPSADRMRMYIQPMSNSYQRFDSLAEVANEW